MKRSFGRSLLTVLFAVLALLWVAPIAVVLLNSFKVGTAIALTPFSWPTAETFVGLQNYIGGIYHGDYPFYLSMLYSLIITVLSVGLILLCT